MLTFDQNPFMINSLLSARNYKIILCTFTEYKNRLSIIDSEKSRKIERTFKYHNRAFSSIKNKQKPKQKFTPYSKNKMCKAKHVSNISNRITV